MKNFRMIRHQLKEPVIYKSKHEPFLSGNIARGVIEMISRKAISPLTRQIKTICNKKFTATGSIAIFKKYATGKNILFLPFMSGKDLYPDNSKKFSGSPFVYLYHRVCLPAFRLMAKDRLQHPVYPPHIHRYIKNNQTQPPLLFLYY